MNIARTRSEIRPGAILADGEIFRRLDLADDLKIYPMLHPAMQIRGCKVDLHLSGVFYEFKHSALEVYDPMTFSRYQAGDYRREILLPPLVPYILHPGAFVLSTTFENVVIPHDLLGVLQGRSSLARLGIIVHATASFIDPGFKGTITFELSNLGDLPVALYTLAPVATIAFEKVSGKVLAPYGSKAPSPIDANEEERHGRHDSPTSVPSRYGSDWEFKVFRKLQDQNSK